MPQVASNVRPRERRAQQPVGWNLESGSDNNNNIMVPAAHRCSPARSAGCRLPPTERTIEPDRQAAMPRVAAAAANRLVALMRLPDLCARDQADEEDDNNERTLVVRIFCHPT